MPHKFYKHKLLLDEGLYPKQYLKRTNSRYDVKHIKHDLNKGGIKDEEVHEIAVEQKRIVVTYNIDDFKKLATKTKIQELLVLRKGCRQSNLIKN